MKSQSRTKMLVAVALLLALLLAGQATADTILPIGGGGDTGRAIGDAGFAYLSGVRTAIAAMLWNRLDPQMHEYYDGVVLEEQTYVLPTISIVIALDPEFEQAYFVAPWIIARRGSVDEAIELARVGTVNVPRSGMLRASYAQMIAVFVKDYARAAEQADIAVDLEWPNLIDQHNWYGILRSIYEKAGRDDMVDSLGLKIDEIDAVLGDQLGADEHDHDGDGKPDH